MGSQQPPNGAERKRQLRARPWLRSGGEEVPTRDLENLSKTWSAQVWEQYLTWYESGRREALVSPLIYEKKGEEISESVFESMAPAVTPAKRGFCERILALLPELQSLILRRYYLDGKTLAKIGEQIGRSANSVGHHKRMALSALKRGLVGDIWCLCRLMRRENRKIPKVEPSIWEESSSYPVREDRDYRACDQKYEIDNLKDQYLRAVILELGKYAQRILYLRYWCGFSTPEIARDLRLGLNVVEQIEDAAITKLKRKAIEFQTGNQMGGDQC